MKKSWNIGRVFGIDIKIHLTFFFLIIWIGFSSLLSGGSLSAMLMDVLFIVALFIFVVMHEFGHALTARRFGIGTQDITLLPIGGVAKLERMPENPKEEFLVAIAGPMVNVVISGIIFSGLLISGFFSQPINLPIMIDNFWVQLLSANLTLAVFNLIPAFPMDGGRVLRALLATSMDNVKATRIAATVGKVIAVVMGIAGFFLNPWLILIAFFVWSGAGAEAQAVELKAGLEGLVVRDAMISQFYQVEANQPLKDAFQLSVQTGQNDLPVVSNGRFLGFIRRKDLLKAIDSLGNRSPAYAAIGSEPNGLDPEMPLVETLTKFATSRILPVIENDQLIGLVTAESIQQSMWLQQRMDQTNARPPEEKTTPV